MRGFSMGFVYALPQGANPTPIPAALIQGATAEAKQSKVPLRGPYKYPVDFGDGDGDLTIKIQQADWRASTLTMLSGGTITTGSKIISPGESFTVPTTPFQVTVAQSATFSENASVWDVTAQKWLDVVPSAPATGQYSFAAGVYTFAAADVAHVVVIYYVYTSASVGKTTTVLNQLQGPSTYFLVRIYNSFLVAGVVKPAGWEFPQVHFPSLSMALKVGNWTDINLEGVCSADVGQTLYKAYTGD
jgi:hypothetical protein